MGSDEEYLDDLLKSIAEDEGESGSPWEAEEGEGFAIGDSGEVSGESDTVGNFAFEDIGADDEPMDDFTVEDFGMEDGSVNDFAIGDVGEDGEPIDDSAIEEPAADFAIEDFGMEEEPAADFAIEDLGTEEEPAADFAIEDLGMEEESIADFAAEDVGIDEGPTDNFAIEDFGAEEMPTDDMAWDSAMPEEPAADFAIEDFGAVEPEEDGLAAAEEALISADDVDAMFAAADAAATEEKPEIEINSEEDMLALLDSMSNEMEAEQAAEQASATADMDAEPVEEEEGKGKKKKRKKRFGGKKKGDKEQADEAAGEDGEAAGESDKKPGFFSKFLTFLTEEDEEEEDRLKEGLEPSDENKSILEELDKEDKKKKKKKEKGKKGKEEGGEEKGKGQKKEKKEKKKKEKKEKKEKAAADTLETAPERPSKRISKKSVAVVAALGLTLTAMIIVFCSVVPAFFDKREALEAYYQSDYKRSYELLYGKKLDESDTIIYNQSRVIVEMNRNLDAYHNYLAIGERVRALDALMMGVQKYPDIMLDAEEYHVTQEVDAVYETILNILNDKYGISENVANVIIGYDDLTYTRKLESVVNGTPFADPNAEVYVAPDVLSEEQDFYEGTPDNVLGQSIENGEDAGTDGQADTVLLEDTEEVLPSDATEEASLAENAESDTDSGSSYIAEEPVSEEASVPEENSSGSAGNTGTSSGGQGQMIQGVRQPIDVQIHEN